MLKHLIILTGISLVSTALVYSQEKPTKTDTSASEFDFREFLLNPYSFDRPDSSFVPMTEQYGYEHPVLQAKISCMAIPGLMGTIRSEIGRPFPDGRPAMKLIDSTTRFINSKEFFISVSEMPTPDPKFKDFYMISIATQFEKSTVMVIGAYSKSLDKALREKFIKSATTVRHD